jgi:hypothetical protein
MSWAACALLQQVNCVLSRLSAAAAFLAALQTRPSRIKLIP